VNPGNEHNASVIDTEPWRPFQAESYIRLLKFPAAPASSRSGARAPTLPAVDAIVVPTIRSAENLRSAVQLAVETRCELIPLYTESFPRELSSVLAHPRLSTTPLALPYKMKHELLDLAARLPQKVVSSSARDISRKRNLGLLIGRMCGWTRMLFLDDDICMINAKKLNAAATLLDEYPVVGLQVNKYPDASVVGHARRLTERKQKPFISGGSLLVNPQSLQGYFPAVYHEDWFCVMNHFRLGQVAIGGAVGQLVYEPFITPQRARLEEFGDTLAAGLLWLLSTKQTSTVNPAADNRAAVMPFRDFCHEATASQFWVDILSQRQIVLDKTYERLERRYKKDSPSLKSLKAAQDRHGELQAREFVSFTKKWLYSLEIWQTRLSDLPRADSVIKALAELGLSDVVRTHEAGRQTRAVASTVTRRTLGSPSPIRGVGARRWPVPVRAAEWVATQHLFESALHDGLLSVGRWLRGSIEELWRELAGRNRNS
jgi:hypothetical protein